MKAKESTEEQCNGTKVFTCERPAPLEMISCLTCFIAFSDCLERSPIFITLCRVDSSSESNACMLIEDLHGKTESTYVHCNSTQHEISQFSRVVILWRDELGQSAMRSTLHLSTSRVLDNCDNGTARLDPAEAIQRNDRHNDPPNSWDTVLCQLSPFTMVLSNMLSEVSTSQLYPISSSNPTPYS